MTKLYAVYLAFHKSEVYPDEVLNANPLIPDYPPEIARLRVYDNPQDQLDCYVNVHCPASITFEVNSKKELDEKEEETKRNFLNDEWLDKHIRPYV